MTAQTILPANSAASGGFEVANSIRLDGNAYMYKDQSGGNRQIFTMSCWTKLTSGYGASAGSLLSVNGTDDDTNFHFGIDHGDASGGASDSLFCHIYGADAFRTTPLLRDYSAWYHIVLAVDTTQAAAENRMKVYVNNVQQTLSQQGDYPDQNDNFGVNENGARLGVGTHPGSVAAYALNSYLCEYVLIDGSQLTPASFGEADEDSGIWKPIKVSGLTFGTNGFYLDFQASGNLGNDANGGTDLTEVSIAATDQSTDTCTNNFATMNPLDNFHQGTAFSEGNLKLVHTAGNRTWNTCNVALSSGKWYCEILKGATEHDTIGIHYKLSAGLTDRPDSDSGAWSFLGGKNYDDGSVKTDGGSITYTILPTNSGDIVGLYLDLHNNKVYFGVNGTVAHSGVGISIPAASTLENGHYYIFGGSDSTSTTMTHTWNFGSPAVAISSANTDAEGFGSFEFSPSGTFDSASKDFLAICTKNLAEYG